MLLESKVKQVTAKFYKKIESFFLPMPELVALSHNKEPRYNRSPFLYESTYSITAYRFTSYALEGFTRNDFIRCLGQIIGCCLSAICNRQNEYTIGNTASKCGSCNVLI